jgi:CxxC motif-containing protein
MSTEKRHFICVTCPIGCEIDVETRDGEIVSMSGNKCSKGEEFVLQELKEPMRTLTSTVRVRGARWAMLPVRTDDAIPKRLFPSVLAELARVELEVPVKMSEVILSNVAGTGADIVATRSMDRSGHNPDRRRKGATDVG